MSTPPDDRTLLVPASVPPGAGAPSTVQVEHALPPGTKVGGFEISSVLGAGGFGIVYLAYDDLLQRHVALKEYMPSAFALRTQDGRVRPRGEREAEAFGIGLRSFVNEARLLAHFDAPSLLKVYRFWEAAGTAYMVMPYYRGPTLKQVLAQAAAPMDEATLRRLLADLLDALALLHAQQCYHRDIAPDNILMVDGRQPVLLDFGAARSAIGDMTQAFTAIFKQAYAPVEQIGGDGDMRQGPWTDLFALASVVHFAIDGRPPPPSIGRLLSDTYVPLALRHADRYSPAFLAAIDSALAVKPRDRPQSVDEMRALLGAAPAQAAQVAAPGTPGAAAMPATAAAPGPQQAQAPRPAARAWRRRALLLPAAAVVAAIGIGGGFLAMHTRAPQPTGTAAVPAPAQVPPRAAAVALDRLVAGASPGHDVSVALSRPRVVIDEDLFGFSIRSTRGGHVYVYMLGSDQDQVLMIFPNALDRDNRIAPGQILSLPRKSWEMQVGGPAGTDRFLALVSDQPRAFQGTLSVPGQSFSAFAPDSAAAALAGTPVCAPGAPCPNAYGAVAFKFDVVAP